MTLLNHKSGWNTSVFCNVLFSPFEHILDDVPQPSDKISRATKSYVKKQENMMDGI